MSPSIRPALPLVLAIALAGCMPEGERCDPDQRYSYGLCYSIDGAVAPDTDPGTAGKYDHYGDVCTGDGDCAAPTDFCAKYPGDPTGYCTRTGCLADASLCPTGWTCVDLTVFLPGLPAICTRP